MKNTVPKILNGEAKEFWKRNSKQLIDDGRLTEATKEAFIVFCLAYGDWFDARANNKPDWLQQQMNAAVNKQFDLWGMNPDSRKRLKLDEKKGNLADVLKQAMESNAKESEDLS